MGGTFTTKQKALVDFKFPELDNNKTVTWICHVDDATNPENTLYDMIIGMDSMVELGIHIDTETKRVCWKENSTPLANRGTYQDAATINTLYHMTVNENVMEAEARQARILDADYSKVNIYDYVKELST